MESLTRVNLDANVDLNSLFSLSYNFDTLKGVIDALIKAQRKTNTHLGELENKIAVKDDKILEMKEEIDKLNVLIVNNVVNKKSSKKFNDLMVDKNSDNDITGNKEEKKQQIMEDKHIHEYRHNLTAIDSTVDSDNNFSLSLTSDEQMNKLIKKINYIEYQVKILSNLGNELTEVKKKVSDHTEDIFMHQNSINEIKHQLQELDLKVSDHNLQFQEINMKLLNFETFNDPFKSKDGEDRQFSNEELNLLISTMDKKFTMKMTYIDERFKKDEDEILKLKQLERKLDQTNSNLIITNKNVEANKEQITALYARLEDLKTLAKNLTEMNKGEFNEKFEWLKKYCEEKISELSISFKTLINNNSNQNNNTEDSAQPFDNTKIKDIQKRLTDIEKNFKVFVATINIEVINKEISKIKAELEDKSTKQDLIDMKDLYNQLLYQINQLKETVHQILDDRKMLDELIWLRKKVETLSSNLITLKNNDESMNNNTSLVNKNIPLDNSKYVEVNVYNEFKNTTLKEMDAMNSSINVMRGLIDEIMLLLKSKVNDKDLKALEEFLLSRIEELRIGCIKKFADKNETAKNLKYLDAQIRQIMEIYKKTEKADNWLLAKKPLGGNSCASCEAYIGDLHDNTQYVPWNKYPGRDQNDKLYRIGNGFSKMLQMINLDNYGTEKKPNATSYDFYKNVGNHMGQDTNYNRTNININKTNSQPQKKVNLPAVKSNQHKGSLNLSANDVDQNDFENTDEILQPKIVKIFKKAKEKKID